MDGDLPWVTGQSPVHGHDFAPYGCTTVLHPHRTVRGRHAVTGDAELVAISRHCLPVLHPADARVQEEGATFEGDEGTNQD